MNNNIIYCILLICLNFLFIKAFISKNNHITTSFINHRKIFSSSSLYMGGVPVVPYRPRKESKDYQWMDIYNALGRDRTLFVSR